MATGRSPTSPSCSLAHSRCGPPTRRPTPRGRPSTPPLAWLNPVQALLNLWLYGTGVLVVRVALLGGDPGVPTEFSVWAVAIATGGYTSQGLHPRLRSRIMPILSNSLVTRPLTADEIARLSDDQRLAEDIATDTVKDDVRPEYAIYMFDPANQTWLIVAAPPAGFSKAAGAVSRTAMRTRNPREARCCTTWPPMKPEPPKTVTNLPSMAVYP